MEATDLIPRAYGAHIYEDNQGRVWITESTVRPLEQDDLINVGGVLYEVIVYAPARNEYLVRAFSAVITEEDWPLLEEEPPETPDGAGPEPAPAEDAVPADDPVDSGSPAPGSGGA